MAEPGIGGEMPVEVVYARADRQELVQLLVPRGCTVSEAITRSQLIVRFPEIDLTLNKVGIFGRLCPLDRVLEPGDRVEIYRPLVADPKEVRRRLAAEGRTMGKKGTSKSE